MGWYAGGQKVEIGGATCTIGLGVYAIGSKDEPSGLAAAPF